MAAHEEHSQQPLKRATDRLCAELQVAWQVLTRLSDEVLQSSSSVRETTKCSGTLPAIHAWYEDISQRLLARPVDQWLKLRPTHRALDALHACDREISASALRVRRRIDSRFQRVLVQATLDLSEPWRIWRGGNRPVEWRAWEQRRSKYDKEAIVLFGRYQEWASRNAGDVGPQDQKALKISPTETWWREQRAVAAALEMELALRNLTVDWFKATELLVADLLREREAILADASSTLRRLEASATATTQELGLVSPDERLRTWASPVEAGAAQRLPEQVELLVGDMRPRWRSIPARASFLRTFDTYARAPMRGIIEQCWGDSAALVREVEQAREIVAYWSEGPSSSSSEAKELLDEARQNAIGILRAQTQISAQPEHVDAETVKAFWCWHEKGSTALEAEQYGWITLLRRPRGRAILDTAAEAGQLRAVTAVQRAGRWTSGQIDRALEFIGGRVPAHPTLEPVVRRTTLRDTLSLPAAKTTTLPSLYRLLFRLAPVEDRRFLVGRDHELAGLKQAAEDWEEGRFAACLMVGARGSGKTSLLNCAVRDVFAGRACIRAEFDERILNSDGMDTFLRELLGLNGDADIEAALGAERRIVILEESERIYLRRVGGFAAAYYLMHLIHRSAATTLWIIVMNDKAFRVLDAGTGLRRVFSHRINAMNVSRSDLENAILERHRLSGLRLKFAPPPAGDPRVNRVKRWIGLEESAQRLFFDSLFQQSEGIFRSAFELWLSSIQRVEGETLTIRQPLDPAFARFRSELAQEDQFSLLLVQEHGSLTQDELAEVLCEPYDLSRSRMERLTALGLIEADPEHRGLRVRPEAQRFVNDLLRRTNLT
jgi:hypothetical protein